MSWKDEGAISIANIIKTPTKTAAPLTRSTRRRIEKAAASPASSEAPDTQGTPVPDLGCLWYVPNVVGYLRLVLTFTGLYYGGHAAVASSGKVGSPFMRWTPTPHQSVVSAASVDEGDARMFLVCCGLAGLLDLVDGPIARKLGQTSAFGAILDVVCDNVLRGGMWILAAACYPKYLTLPAVLVVLIEWFTFLSTQIAGLLDGGRYWKEQTSAHTPAIVAKIFANNFKNPLGAWAILSLFLSPGFFLSRACLVGTFAGWLPWEVLDVFGWLMVAGRVLVAITAEFHLCSVFVCALCVPKKEA